MWGYEDKDSLYGYSAGAYSEETDPKKSVGASSKSNPTQGAGNDWTWAYGSPQNYKKENTFRAQRSSGATSNSGGTRVTNLRPTMAMPEMTDVPSLVLPKIDKRRIAALQQTHAAPGIRMAREALQANMNEASDNPNVRRLTLREALQGYGAGIENVMSGAARTAQAEHGQEVELAGQEAMANWKMKQERAMADYNAKMQAYLRTMETVQTDSPNEAAANTIWRRDPSTMSLYQVQLDERGHQISGTRR